MSDYRPPLVIREMGKVAYIPGHPFTDHERKALLANGFLKQGEYYVLPESDAAEYAAKMIKRGGSSS